MFYEEFKSYFTEEEWNTQIVKIWTQIGINTERTILEEFNRLIRNGTELIDFPSSLLRSWLAFFLMPVRNMVAGSGSVILKITKATGTVPVNAGWSITNKAGFIYEVKQSALVEPGKSIALNVMQGQPAVSTGVYSTIIAIPKANIDFTTEFSVTINEEPILPVHQVQRTVIPIDGYYAYYFDNTLYVKIYKGSSMRNGVEHATADPEGKKYVVKYRVVAGEQANTAMNGFEAFTNQLVDVNKNPVEYKFENIAIINNVSAPMQWELVNMVRSRFFISGSVSSIPEYTTWFNSQPEVGDCIVLGDYERWMMGLTHELIASGRITVMLMDNEGKPIETIMENNTRPFPNSVLDIIDKRLTGIKDISVIDYEYFEYIKQYFKIEFTSSTNNVDFISYAESMLRQFFNLQYVRNNGMSLFEALDMTRVLNTISTLHAPTGVRIIPYHYFEMGRLDDGDTLHGWGGEDFWFTCYTGEIPGGYYEYWEPGTLGPDGITMQYDPDGEMYKKYTLIERLQEDGNGIIYVRLFSESEQTYIYVAVGSNVQGKVSIQLDDNSLFEGTHEEGLLKCFFLIKNQGNVPVGKVNGARAFAGVEFEQVG